MSRSLRTVPAGALAAFAVVLLASPQAEAVAGRAARPAVGAPQSAASAHPSPAGRQDHSGPGAPPLGSPHGWGGQQWAGRPVGGRAEADDERRTPHGWGTDRRAGRGRNHRPADQVGQEAARPHGVPGEEGPAPSGAPGGTPDERGHDRPAARGDGGTDPAPHAVDGPGWLAPVARPADPLFTSGVWHPAGPARPQDRAPAQAGPAVDRTATALTDAPVLPVLTFGAGLTSLGLGIAFFALRLRRG